MARSLLVTLTLSPRSSPALPDGHPALAIVEDIRGFRSLQEGWDGERAAKPSAGAIQDAVDFVQGFPDAASRLEPSLHVDGSVLLEVAGPAGGSLRFSGFRTVTCALDAEDAGIVQGLAAGCVQ